MPLQLTRLTLRELRLPLREPFRISSGTQTMRRILLLELEDAAGAAVWSECVAPELPNYGPETIDTAWLALTQWAAPRVLGRGYDDPAEVFPDLERDFRGHLMAKAAVEMGFWALDAEHRGISLALRLGGIRPALEIGISLGIQRDPAALVERAAVARRDGYRKIKLKIQPGADVAFIRAVREALGGDAPLMADANNAYTLADADHLRRLDDFGLLMLEQPLAWDDLTRHARLQQVLQTPLCLDESITSLDRAEDMVTLGSGRIINIKPGRVGGFGPSIAIHNFCAARGIPVWCGGMLESGVGRAYNVALASLPNFLLPGDISPSARYWAADIVTPEWSMNGHGLMTVPLDRPGIGVHVDRDLVARLTVREERLGRSR